MPENTKFYFKKIGIKATLRVICPSLVSAVNISFKGFDLQKINFPSVAFTISAERILTLCYTCCWYISYCVEKGPLEARVSFIATQFCSSLMYKMTEELYAEGCRGSGRALFLFFHPPGLKAADSKSWHELPLGGSISVPRTSPSPPGFPNSVSTLYRLRPYCLELA
jgi:hypothetical protein